MATATRKLDPRKDQVSFEHLELAADLVRSAGKNLNVAYWEEVPVPLQMDDRIPFEGMRRLAVFLPLVAVVLALLYSTKLAALATFALVFPLMVWMDKKLDREVYETYVKNLRFDSGRYAFTRELCREYDLKPQDVTLKLVRKMCADYLRVQQERKDGELAAAHARIAAREAEREAFLNGRRKGRRRQTVDTNDNTTSGHLAAGAALVGAAAVGGAAYAADTRDFQDQTFGHEGLEINPANGLPMVGAVDIHGNAYGTTSVDDMLHANDHLTWSPEPVTHHHAQAMDFGNADCGGGCGDPFNNGF